MYNIGGLTGDWGGVAAILSILNKEKYAVWTDRVEHDVFKAEAKRKSIIKRVYNCCFKYNMLKNYHRILIKKAHVGLFHGNDCYKEYSPISRNPHLVHNLHLKEEDQISLNILNQKIRRQSAGGPIKICYVGRMTEMKGPSEWLDILYNIKKKDIPFVATWLGDGDLFEEIKEKTTQLDLTDEVVLAGYVKDMEKVKAVMQASDIFLFCHKTKESPRSLIEALKSACPIVGFRSEYPEDLIKENGGGMLIKDFSVEKTVEVIENIYRDRKRLKRLIENSYKDGLKFSDKWVFKHRSDIVKRELV